MNNFRADSVLNILEGANQNVSAADRQTKFGKMAEEPLVFYRGSNQVFWADFAGDPRLDRYGNRKTRVWINGDLHPYNFGSFHNDRDEIIFNLNDFDEAIVADYQYDVWRMAIGMELVARRNETLADDDRVAGIDAFARSYLDTLAEIRRKKATAKICFTSEDTYGKLDNFLEKIESEYSREGMLERRAPVSDETRAFDFSRDKLEEVTDEQRETILAAIADYRTTLSNDPSDDLGHFKVKDVARRLLAGTGSLGRSRYYLLIEAGEPGNQTDDRILDVKLQRKPSAYANLSEKEQQAYDDEFENHARRHALAYRALTRHTDDYLGWIRLDDGDYSVRERSPYKEAFPGEELQTGGSYVKLAEQWGWILATDHARASKKLPKSLPKQVGRLTDGKHDGFCELVTELAIAYADQVEVDWQAFVDRIEETS